MIGIVTKISAKTTIYIIILVVSLATFILLESWPGLRALMQRVDQSLGIVNLNWALLLASIIIGFLFALIICNKGEK